MHFNKMHDILHVLNHFTTICTMFVKSFFHVCAIYVHKNYKYENAFTNIYFLYHNATVRNIQ